MGRCRLKYFHKTLASFVQHAQLAQRAACYLIWKALCEFACFSWPSWLSTPAIAALSCFSRQHSSARQTGPRALFGTRGGRLGLDGSFSGLRQLHTTRKVRFLLTQKDLPFKLAWLRRRRPSSQRWHPRQEHNHGGKTASRTLGKTKNEAGSIDPGGPLHEAGLT